MDEFQPQAQHPKTPLAVDSSPSTTMPRIIFLFSSSFDCSDAFLARFTTSRRTAAKTGHQQQGQKYVCSKLLVDNEEYQCIPRSIGCCKMLSSAAGSFTDGCLILHEEHIFHNRVPPLSFLFVTNVYIPDGPFLLFLCVLFDKSRGRRLYVRVVDHLASSVLQRAILSQLFLFIQRPEARTCTLSTYSNCLYFSSFS
ncbi:hypothetical protein C8J56DRAFT_11319 [Mycena floridula]|nr:hypothetical protein C8J56DRAFT_11319 [Mycena floridula]